MLILFPGIQGELARELAQTKEERKQLTVKIDQLESKQSSLKEECVELKEYLSKTSLGKEVLEQEREQLNEQLKKSELKCAETELEVCE